MPVIPPGRRSGPQYGLETKKPADRSAGFSLRSNRGQLLSRGGLAFSRSDFCSSLFNNRSGFGSHFFYNRCSLYRRFSNRSNFNGRGSFNSSRCFFFLATSNDEQGGNRHNSKLVHETYLTKTRGEG